LTDVYLDGCGVLPDQPLPVGSRIRFRLCDDAGRDVTAHVANGVLHVQGFRLPVDVGVCTAAHVTIQTRTLGCALVER
jgi:hypothetical protein